jgi:hypothetical protein
VIERHVITSREQWLDLRRLDVTASVAPALLGVHQYRTVFEMWALKSGLLTEDPDESPSMRRGRLLEPVALELLRELRPQWTIEAPGVYLRDPALRIGATPDAFAICPERGAGIVQVKCVEPSVFRSQWRDPETREVAPPLWIAVQAIVEARLTGAAWAAVAPLRVGHGIDIDVIDVPLHDGLMRRIESEVAAFWRAVESGQPPSPDFARDGETIAALHPTDADGPAIDLTAWNELPELIAEREAIAARAKADKARREAIDAEITLKLDGHPVGILADGREITRTIQNRGAFAVEATSFPVIRVRNARRNAA